MNLEAVTSEIFLKGDPPAIERLCRFLTFRRAQLQPFAFYTTRRRNDASAILHGAFACNFVIDILATWIDALRKSRHRRC